jgi:predicted phosphodiesterase
METAWCSDTHFNLWTLSSKRRFFTGLNDRGVERLIISGDVSTGRVVERDLEVMSRFFNGHVHFVLGNHDYHGRYIDSVHTDVQRITRTYPRLHWLTHEHVVSLSDDVALIGTEGWYDAIDCSVNAMKLTTDWHMTFDFSRQENMYERVEAWRNMANRSSDVITDRLERALDAHRMVYVVTHFPPWKEATRAVGTLLEGLWVPYNTNVALGKAIERVMVGRNDEYVVVLAGHTHVPCNVRISNNIECRVAGSSCWGSKLHVLTV